MKVIRHKVCIHKITYRAERLNQVYSVLTLDGIVERLWLLSLDSDKVISVSGQLDWTRLPYEVRHPIIMR